MEICIIKAVIQTDRKEEADIQMGKLNDSIHTSSQITCLYSYEHCKEKWMNELHNCSNIEVGREMGEYLVYMISICCAQFGNLLKNFARLRRALYIFIWGGGMPLGQILDASPVNYNYVSNVPFDLKKVIELSLTQLMLRIQVQMTQTLESWNFRIWRSHLSVIRECKVTVLSLGCTYNNWSNFKLHVPDSLHTKIYIREYAIRFGHLGKCRIHTSQAAKVKKYKKASHTARLKTYVIGSGGNIHTI